MPDIISKSISFDKLIDLHQESKICLTRLYHDLSKNDWNETIDARIIPVKLLIEGVDSKLIVLLLLREHYSNSKIWDLFKIDNASDLEKIANIKLSSILGDFKSGLFMQLFMQLEHFIRIIASSLNVNSRSINKLTKKIITETKIDIEFENLIDLITHARNTIHFGGIRTDEDDIVLYKGIEYNFKKGEHTNFFNDYFLHYLIIEVSKFIEQINSSSKVISIPEIRHPYSDFTWVLED